MSTQSDQHDTHVSVGTRTPRDGAPGESQHSLRSRLPVSPAVLIGALVALVAIGVAGGWLVLRGGDAEPKQATRAPAAGISVAKLNRIAGNASRPVFWAGALPKTTYELSQTKDGRVFIRYLPPGVKVGDPRPKYLTVGTYPQKNAFATLQATAKTQGVETFELSGGGLAFQDKTHATSVYLAFPGSNYQIEVFDPNPARALQLVQSGQVVAIAGAAKTGAVEASRGQLKAAAAKAGHPVYWAGADSKLAYELTQTRDGRVYIRYLPAGVAAGVRRPDFLTVGTYPQKAAFAALKKTALTKDAKTFKVAGGGLAYADPTHPTSVYVAFPSSAFQIEVYDPDPMRAKQTVTSGQIVPVG